MATITTTLKIVDAFSPALKHMNTALNMVISSLEQTKRKLGTPIDTSSFQAAREHIGKANQALQGLSNQSSRTAATVASSMAKTGNSTVKEMNKASYATHNLTNRLKEAIKYYLGYKAAVGTFKMADTMASSNARLAMVNDGSMSQEALNQKIFEMAEKTRSSYMSTAQIVGRIGLNAGQAFGGTQEVIDFVEQMNKLLIVGGATTQEAQSTIIQLSQALSSGKLQGDEFRSIAENAPLVQQAVAKYMKVSRGALKDLSKKGEITTEILKNAIMAMADETNARFESMPRTWGQVWESFKNKAMKGLQPLLDKLTELSNSNFMTGLLDTISMIFNKASTVISTFIDNVESIWSKLTIIFGYFKEPLIAIWEDFVNAAGFALYKIKKLLATIFTNDVIVAIATTVVFVLDVIGSAIGGILTLIGNLIQVIIDNWSIVEPILWGVAAALLVQAAMAGWAALQTGIAAAAAVWKTICDWGATAAIIAMEAAQHGLNAAMQMCPLVWIIDLIIILIVLFYLAVAAINHFAGTSISATGIIFAAFYSLYMGIYNGIAVIWNAFLNFATFLVNVFNNPIYALKKAYVNLGTMFLDLCIAMTEGWDKFATNMANAMIDAVNLVIQGWNKLVDMLPDMVKNKLGLGKAEKFEHTVSITSDLKNAKKDLESWLGEPPKDYNDLYSKYKMDFKGSKDLIDAYNLGDKISNFKFSDLTDALNDKMGFGNTSNLKSLLKMFDFDQLYQPDKYIHNGRPIEADPSYKHKLNSPYGSGGALSDIAKNTGKIADNTDNLGMTNEELKYLRQIGEREAINKYTTAQIKVNNTNNNNISSDMDLNSILRALTDMLSDAMSAAAEAPHI